MRDVAIYLKPQYENPFHHGWLAAHFGWARSSAMGGVTAKESQCAHDGWLCGYDTAMETPRSDRLTVLGEIINMEFE